MRFLDAVTVIVSDDHWPTEGDSRSCALSQSVSDICDPENEVITLDGQGDGDTYRIVPFAVDLEFDRRVSCSRQDDDSWLESMAQEATDQAVLIAFTQTSPYAAGQQAGVGLWSDGVAQISDTGDPAETLINLRRAWAEQNVAVPGSPPILFVDPAVLGALYDSRLIVYSGDGEGLKIHTIWGDPVISMPVSSEQMAITGPITVYLSQVDVVKGHDQLGNKIAFSANRGAMVDVPPCSIIVASPLING